MTAEPNLAPPPQPPGARRPPEHGSRNPYATYVDLDAPAAGPGQAPPPPAPPYGYAPPPGSAPPPGYGPPPTAYFVPATPPKRGRGGRTAGTVLTIVAGLAGFCGGTGAYGLSSYWKKQVCAEFAAMGQAQVRPAPAGGSGPTEATSGPVIGDATLDQPAGLSADMRTGAAELRRASKWLVFSGDLQTATEGIAGDMVDTADTLDTFHAGAAADRVGTLQRLQAIVERIDTHARQGQQACGQAERGFVL